MEVVRDATINFTATNKLGVKFDLTETFTVPVINGSVFDFNICRAIQKAHPDCKIDFPYYYKGGPIWREICSINVIDTVDY